MELEDKQSYSTELRYTKNTEDDTAEFFNFYALVFDKEIEENASSINIAFGCGQKSTTKLNSNGNIYLVIPSSTLKADIGYKFTSNDLKIKIGTYIPYRD